MSNNEQGIMNNKVKNIAIIDYGAGNVRSVQFALERLGYNSVCTNTPKIIQEADKVIFPGVGEASSAMEQLRNSGIAELLPQLKQDVLGICLGMQLMCLSTEEGNAKGLGVFPVDVLKFKPDVKIPHMGWNTIKVDDSSLFKNIPDNSFVYFVHSYYVPLNEYSIANTNYSTEYSSALNKNNFYACQFHPEKSGSTGEIILKNFLAL